MYDTVSVQMVAGMQDRYGFEPNETGQYSTHIDDRGVLTVEVWPAPPASGPGQVARDASGPGRVTRYAPGYWTRVTATVA